MNCRSLLTLLFLLCTNLIWAQKSAKEEVLANTNQRELKKLSAQFAAEAVVNKQKAIEVAKQKGWPIRQKLKNGKEIEIQAINAQGVPVYYETHNSVAAQTLSTDLVYPGGGMGLNLTGLGMTLGEWDGGAVRTSHQEFGGRVTQRDGATTLSDHATHVGGTMVAGGVDASARGMAYQGNLDAYDWTNDNSEMAAAAASGLLVSNHSYGSISGWYNDGTDWYWYGVPSISATEDYQFGYYDQGNAEAWDQIAYNAPYYLIIKSAGNDRGDSHSGTHFVFDPNSGNWVTSTASRPADGGTTGYDCISNGGTAKNVLTVGAVGDIPGGYSSASGVLMTSFSGWGPTDDGRIKPDVVGNGYIVYSTGSSSNNDYGNKSGTSMASPNVSGSLILLQQHYNALNSAYMRSASLKGLTIHTADEAGTAVGPDYVYGWGLMNTAKAAQFITDNDKEIIETSLTNGGSYTKNFYNDGTKLIRATICWTDPKANALPINSAVLNNTTRRLINDLDIRITGPTGTFQPYILNPSSPSSAATTGDNDRDNVEQIYIAVPAAGNYSLVVTHKGSLSTAQNFSLIFEGETVAPANDDAGIASIINPTRYACDNPFVPQVVLQNFGSTTLSSVTINYQIDNGPVNTQAWSGSLASGSTTTVTLPSTTVTAGATFTFRAYTTNPNATIDGDISNDTSAVLTTHLIKNALPYAEGFNAGASPTNIELSNEGSINYFWEHTTDATASGAGAGFGSFVMDNFSPPNNISDTLDWFFLPTFDLSTQSNNQLTFDVAYARYGAGNSDTLIVAINSNCGNLFTPVYYKGGSDLSTSADIQTNFTPTSTEWRTETIDLSAYAGQANVRIAFINKSGWGNRMFIDDINIPSGTVNVINDAGIDSIANPVDSTAFCTSPFAPEVQIRNFGTTTLASATINYQIDNGTINTFAWTGSLAPNAATMVTLPMMTGPGTGAPFTFRVYTSNPNGATDNDSANDTSSVYTQEILAQALPYMEALDAGVLPADLGFGGFPFPLDGIVWEYTTVASGYGTGIGTPATNNGTMRFDNFTADTRGTQDYMFLPWLDFSGQTGVQLTFDVAHSRYSGTYNDTLAVYISSDCGQTYQEVYRKSGSDLATAPDAASEFTPTSSQWRTETISLGAYDGSSHVRVVFINIGGYSNHVYVDNINVQAAVSCNLTASITSSTNVTCNGGSNGVFSVTAANGSPNYSYNIGSGAQASATFTGLAANTYTVTVTDGAGCTATATTTIAQPAAVTGSITAQQNVLCNGASTGSITVAGSGGSGTGYTYNIGSGAQASGTFSGLSSGSYTVTILDNNGCSGTVSATITQPTSAVTGSITAQQNVLCNGASTGSITVAGSGGSGTGYTYNIGSGAQASGTFSGLSSGSYTVTILDNNGCTGTVSATITQPTSALSVSAVDNGNGSATATGTGGTPTYSYLWDASTGGQTTTTATGLTGGTYSVTVTDVNGCTATDAVTVVITGVEDLPNITAFEVRPNPNRGQFTVQVSLLGTQAATVRVSNVLGQSLLEFHQEAQAFSIPIDIQNQVSGVYFITLSTAKKSITKKIVVDK